MVVFLGFSMKHMHINLFEPINWFYSQREKSRRVDEGENTESGRCSARGRGTIEAEVRKNTLLFTEISVKIYTIEGRCMGHFM